MSWLKKNELDIKRNMTDLRDNIRTNWTLAGQEIGRELHKFWQGSRPGSPAPRLISDGSNTTSPIIASNPRSPSALSRLSQLDTTGGGRSGQSSDFAAGYSLGLIGGVRSWVGPLSRTFIFDSTQKITDVKEQTDADRSKSPREPG